MCGDRGVWICLIKEKAVISNGLFFVRKFKCLYVIIFSMLHFYFQDWFFWGSRKFAKKKKNKYQFPSETVVNTNALFIFEKGTVIIV